jgi:hypothetical protein
MLVIILGHAKYITNRGRVRVRVLSKHYGGIFPPLPLFTAHDLTRFLLK